MLTVDALYYPGFEMSLDWLKAFLLLHDSVARIVPTDYPFQDSEDLLRFREALPDAIEDKPSSTELIQFDELQLDHIDRAFAEVERRTQERKLHTTIRFRDEGEFRISTELVGYVFLHKSKISTDVLRLLNKHDLGPARYREFAKGVTGGTDWIPVKREASHLILSLLADRMALQLGCGTVTSEALDYSLIAVTARGVGPLSGRLPGPTATRLLASLVIETLIPDSLNDAPLDLYIELRKELTDIREPFKELVQEAQSAEGLLDVSDVEMLAERLKAISERISEKIETVQARNRFSRFRKWGLFTVGSLVALGSALPLDLQLSLALAAMGITIEGLSLVVPEIESTDRQAERIARRIASLKKELRRELQDSVHVFV